MKQYINDLTPEMLAEFDKPPFTAEQLAADGSLTRNGGKVFSEYNGRQIKPDDGTMLNVSRVGDEVRYPGGTSAKITNGAGNTPGESLPDNFLK